MLSADGSGRAKTAPSSHRPVSAAANLTGNPSVYADIPWFWSDQYDIKLQIAGLSQGYDRTETEGDEAENAFSIRYYQGDRLLCVDAVNAPRAHMLARRELAG